MYDNTISNLIFAIFLVSATMAGINVLFYEVYKNKMKLVLWGICSAISLFAFFKVDIGSHEVDKVLGGILVFIIYLPLPVYSLVKYVKKYEENSKPTRKNDKFLKDYFPMLGSDKLLFVVTGGFLYFIIFICFISFDIFIFIMGIKRLATIFSIGYFSRVRKKLKQNLSIHPEVVILAVSFILFIFI